MGLKTININELDFGSYIGSRYYEHTVDNKLENNIRKYGQIQNIVIYKNNKNDKLYKIIDLYYVAKILKKIGITEVACFDMGVLDDMEASLVSLGLNIKFRHDIMSYATVLKKLQEKYNPEEIEFLTDFLKNEIIEYPKVLEFDFLKYDEDLHLSYNSKDSEVYF